jgi:tRNA pseudouridine32 synthase/23S rRNA pseudouridine746 synthase
MKNSLYQGKTTRVDQLPEHLFDKTSAPKVFDYNPPDEPLNIIHQEDDFIVISKPAGLLSVEGKPAEHKDCLERRILEPFPTATLVHRLDMDTSGLMILALNRATHRHLGLQFERRKTRKTYIAEVWGRVENEEGRIDQPLICDWPNRPKQMISHEIGKEAITDWQVIERLEDSTRLELKPVTGRSHQLRVHMEFLGHPILGDRLYGTDATYNARNRLMLHAERLTVHHPADGEFISFTAPCPFK